MATEKLLVKTKDNRVMAFDITFANAAEKARLKHQCETIANGIDFNAGFSGVVLPAGVMYDTKNSEFLNKEISGYHYRKNRAAFTNNMRHDPPARPNTLFVSHRLSDDEFPEVIKCLGYKIEPIDREYEVKYDTASKTYKTRPDFDKTSASVFSKSHIMKFVRNHYRFPPEDYRLLVDLRRQFECAKQTRPDLKEDDFAATLTDDKQRGLFNFYSEELDRNRQRPITITHELQHIINTVMKDGLALKNNNKRLQTADYYRIAVEDERSAYLSELVKCVNEYLQKGDMNDFSMFNNNNRNIVESLKNLRTPQERKAYAQNWPALVAQKMRDFETDHRDFYDNGMKDERIIYTDKLVKSLTQYYKSDDLNDFSMFSSENQCVVDELRRLNPPSERKRHLENMTNREAMVRRELQRFDRNHPEVSSCGTEFHISDYDADGDNVDEQFNQNVKMYINNAPLAAPRDDDRSEFLKLRSLYYNFKIYNPETHRMEQINLARYITSDMEVSLNLNAQKIIEDADERLRERKAKFDDLRRTEQIDVSLVYPAKELLRNTLDSSKFVTEIESFRISELFSDDTHSPTPPHTPTPTSNEHAEWSDGLKQYWQRVEGYSELAKNSNVYMFKINDATVRYTGKKKVELSSNADYALYDKMLKEPSNRAAPVEFLDTLTDRQKLLLYIACVNNGRRMIGHVPTDLSGISHLRGIPEAELNKFRHRQQNMPSNPQPTPQRQVQAQQRQMSPAVRQEALKRRMQQH